MNEPMHVVSFILVFDELYHVLMNYSLPPVNRSKSSDSSLVDPPSIANNWPVC